VAGYTSFMGYRPKNGVGVIVLCNSSDRVDELAMKLLKVLEKEKSRNDQTLARVA